MRLPATRRGRRQDRRRCAAAPGSGTAWQNSAPGTLAVASGGFAEAVCTLSVRTARNCTRASEVKATEVPDGARQGVDHREAVAFLDTRATLPPGAGPFRQPGSALRTCGPCSRAPHESGRADTVRRVFRPCVRLWPCDPP